MPPLAARRTLLSLAGVLLLGCQDATAPERPAAAAPAPTAIGTAVAVTSHDPVPPADRTTFLDLVALRFQNTAQEAQADAWAQAAYPTPDVVPDCNAAKQLSALTLQYFTSKSLRGQAGNPPVESDTTVVPNDAANIVNTALDVACPGLVVPSNLFNALSAGGAAAYMFAGTGGALQTKYAKAAAVIPAGALPGDALVLIEPLDGYKLPTTLPQGGPYFHFSTYPSFPSFNAPVTVEISQTDASSLANDNTILAHVPVGSSVILPAQSAPCSQLATGTFPVYTGAVPMSLALSADRTFGPGTPTVATTSSGIRCGTVQSWSPFGTIQIYSSTFNRSLLDLQACGTSATGRRFSALNKADQEVVVFYAGTTNGTTYGKKVPIRVGPGSAATPASASFELPSGTTAARLYYGPLTQKTVVATGGAPSC